MAAWNSILHDSAAKHGFARKNRTPLIPASLPPGLYTMSGHSNLIKQTALPAELAPIYLFVASDDSTYVLGQNINVNGGEFFWGDDCRL